MKIDLHGMNIHLAWNVFVSRVTDAHYNKHKQIVVVTGQGAIAKELPQWAYQHSHVRSCTQTPNNPGSFKIVLKKG
jgi:DNA-nicking Smr family endonuclease